MFLAFGFSGRFLADCDIGQPTSFFYLDRETIISHFVYTGSRVQFSR